MDFALTTVLLICLLLPGLIFRRFYYTEEFSKEYFKETIPNFFLSVAVPAAVINVIGWQIVKHWYSFDTETIGILISGTDDSKEVTKALDNLYQYIKPILWYFLLLAFLAFLLGSIAKAIVRNTKLDRRVKLFRFQNEWHYLFSGEILDFPRIEGKASEIDCTYVDILVETHEGSVIYMGILQDYVLSKDGGIERICLTNVRRRFLLQDGNGSQCHYKLPGKFFIIPFSKVLNLHLTYYKVELKDSLKQELQSILETASAQDQSDATTIIPSKPTADS